MLKPKHGLTPVFLIFASLALMADAGAKARVFACEPEWAALAKAVGGGEIEAQSAVTPEQDPHQIQARPSLVASLRRADMLICTGAGLEVGWLPALLKSAKNPKVIPGMPGYFLASSYVRLKEVPRSLDRALGDVHPEGNPHIHTDPANLEAVAKALSESLGEIDPARQGYYARRFEAFRTRLSQEASRLKEKAQPLAGQPVLEAHKLFVYLISWLEMKEVGVLEPKPGVPPTVKDLQSLAETARAYPQALLLLAPYNDPKPAIWLAQHSPVKLVHLPLSPEPTEEGLFSWLETMVNKLLEAKK